MACTIVIWRPEFALRTLLNKTELTTEEVCLLAILKRSTLFPLLSALTEMPSHSSIAAISHWDRISASLRSNNSVFLS